MVDLNPAWARRLDADVADLASDLPAADVRQVRRYVAHLNAICSKSEAMDRAMSDARLLPVGYEHVLVTAADGTMAAVASARRPGAVRVGHVIGTLTGYGRKSFSAISLLADDDRRPGVLQLLVTGGSYPLEHGATCDAGTRLAPEPS